MRSDRRPEDVVGRRDVRDPVAHRLVDGVLQRGRSRRHLADLGAERAHPQHVRRLAADVLGAHVHDAFEVEQRAGGRRRDAVLAGPGLGDDPCLAEAAGQERLAEGVVDLVGAGVVEVLALEVQAQAARLAAAAGLERRGRAGRRDRSASAGRRSGGRARAAPPRTPGSSRIAVYAASRSRSAAMSVSGTKRPPNARSTPQRPRASGSRRPGSTGRGPNGTVGRSMRAARARLTSSATRKGSLVGRPGWTRLRLDAARDVDPDGGDVEQGGRRRWRASGRPRG